eukprot:138957_1
MDVVSQLGLITGLICVLLFAPITIWLLIYFYRLRCVELMKHRQNLLVYCMNLITVTGLLFEWVSLSLNVWNADMSLTWTHFIYLLDNSFLWCVFALFCVKTWLLFYDKQYHASVAAQAWKEQINARYTSWYITNKQKWGNFNYIMKVILIPLLLCMILEGVVETILLQFHVHSMLVLSIIFLIPSAILHCLLKGFDDIYGIKREILYQIIVMFVIMCIHMIELGLIIRSELSDRMDWLIAIIIESVTLFLMSFIPTAYPIYLHRKQCQMRELSKYQTNLASAHSNSELQISPSSSASPHHKTHNRMGHMLTVIADENGFNAFMEHLINEFATESLLFIVELIQIKYEYQTAHGHKLLTPQSAIQGASSPFNFIKLDSLHSETSADLDNPVESYIMNENGTVWAKISLPVGIPRSEALTSSKQLKEQMYALYAKYVSVSSVHTLNIGSDLRKAMDAYFSNNYEQIIHELQAQHKLNIKIKPAAAAATTLEIVSSDSNAPPLIPSKAGNAPPNTPLPAEDSMCTPILDGTPGKKSPSRSRSKSRSRTRSKSKGKMGLKNTLSTPILDGTHDEFPNIPIAKS